MLNTDNTWNKVYCTLIICGIKLIVYREDTEFEFDFREAFTF